LPAKDRYYDAVKRVLIKDGWTITDEQVTLIFEDFWMEALKHVVREVIAGYAGNVLNGFSYLAQSEDGSVLTVVVASRIKGKHTSGVSLIVRIVGDRVIVERDQNDKIVLDACLKQRIPRQQIILAYAGKPVPEIV